MGFVHINNMGLCLFIIWFLVLQRCSVGQRKKLVVNVADLVWVVSFGDLGASCISSDMGWSVLVI